MGARRSYLDIVAGPGAGYIGGGLGVTRISRGTLGLVQSIDGAAPVALGSSTIVPPGTPSLWFDAQNIDGTNNSSLTDGQVLGTWTNLGSVGASGNAVQATGVNKPAFRLVGVAGKLGNKSAVQSSGLGWMRTAVITTLAQPNTIGIVVRSETLPVNEFIVDGASVARNAMLTVGGPTAEMFAGTAATFGALSAAVFASWCAVFNGASSSMRINGSASGALNSGAQGLDGVTLMTDNGSASTPLNGYLVEVLVYNGGGQPTLAQIEAYFASKYGAFPQ